MCASMTWPFVQVKSEGSYNYLPKGKWKSTITMFTLSFVIIVLCSLRKITAVRSCYWIDDNHRHATFYCFLLFCVLWSCNLSTRESRSCLSKQYLWICSNASLPALFVVVQQLSEAHNHFHFHLHYDSCIHKGSTDLFQSWRTRTPWTSLQRVHSPKAPSWIVQSHQPQDLEQQSDHVKNLGAADATDLVNVWW